MTSSVRPDPRLFEKKLGVSFQNKDLLKEALTHRSYLNENPRWHVPHNERLEYLGDAVLELVVSEFLFGAYPGSAEGELTSFRAALVNYQMLASVAREMSLETYLLLSRGEAKDIGRAREVILANAFEAIVGAIYLDRGHASTQRVIHQFLLPRLKEVIEKQLFLDPKSSLQELIQDTYKVTPTYRVLEEHGPDHQKEFTVGAFFGDKLIAKGSGFSKQEAEREAAIVALRETSEKPRSPRRESSVRMEARNTGKDRLRLLRHNNTAS